MTIGLLTGRTHASPDFEVELERGDVVGELELTAPGLTAFTLRGTLPLPPGVYLDAPRSRREERATASRGTRDVPFEIVGADGTVFPTQVEIVSRYPSALDGIDVVEVISQVTWPEGASTGDRISYSVVYAPHTPDGVTTTPAVKSFLNAPTTLVLRTHDVFGHEYTADLLADIRLAGSDLRTKRDGVIARQRRTHEVLLPTTPVTGSTGTMPHLMGVHAYVTEWTGEDFFSLDLRIHNGMSGLDGDEPTDDAMCKLYFRELELRVSSGWTVVQDFENPYLGSEYTEGGYRVRPIVSPMADNKMHVIQQQGQFHRRLVVAKVGEEERALSMLREEVFAFCQPGINADDVEYFSWYNANTGRYFPQSHRLPTLEHLDEGDMRSALAANLQLRRDQVATGAAGIWPATSAGLGWAHPWLTTGGGMAGGTEIWLYDGQDVAWAASQEGYRLYQLMHRMYTDRHKTALFDGDGEAARVEDWILDNNGDPYVPIFYYDFPMLYLSDPFGFESAPTFQSEAVAAQGRVPDYESALMEFRAIDRQHMVRYTRSPMVLAWLGNDAIAKDDLQLQAQLYKFSFNDLPNDNGGYLQPTGLASAQAWVAERPGEGMKIGRDNGWGIHVMNAAYAMADRAWRDEMRPWYDDLIDVVEAGQMECSGILQNQPFPHLFDAQYRCRQSIEAAIVENALVGVRECVYANLDEARTAQVNGILIGTLYAMVSAPVWSTEHRGPWAMMATAPLDVTQPPYCSWIPDGANYDYADHYQNWSSFAYAYELTGDPLFLDKAAEALGGEVLTMLLNDGLDNLWNKAALLALMQEELTLE